MTSHFDNGMAAQVQRAEQSLSAARQLAADGFFDFAASRAYYAVFYAATALLLQEGLDFSREPPGFPTVIPDGSRRAATK